MVELRKRKASQLPTAPPPKKRSAPKTKAQPKSKKEEPPATKTAPAAAPAAAPPPPKKEDPAVSAIPVPNGDADAGKILLGYTLKLDDFGGEVQTHDEKKFTLEKLVAESKAGVVLFTYPKASTPGCTTQACLFRDSFIPLTATGLSLYGLSNDSPKSNTSFKEKQSLPYTLLCDPQRTLIEAIGMKSAKGTQRGVFVIDKSGKVLAKEAGSPQGTVDIVRRIVKEMGGTGEVQGAEKMEHKLAAETAAEVADTAATMDRSKAPSKASTPLPSTIAHKG